MERRNINSTDAPRTSGGYAQAVETKDATWTLYVSGQSPVASNGTLPFEFEDQARPAWRNLEAQLRAADMTLVNIVKHTTFLSDRRYRGTNSEVRQEVLGDHEAVMSPSWFAACFRAETGRPVHAYVMDRRCERASVLITERRLSLAQIAAACGFVHQAHMSRAFKRRFVATTMAVRDT